MLQLQDSGRINSCILGSEAVPLNQSFLLFCSNVDCVSGVTEKPFFPEAEAQVGVVTQRLNATMSKAMSNEESERVSIPQRVAKLGRSECDRRPEMNNTLAAFQEILRLWNRLP